MVDDPQFTSPVTQGSAAEVQEASHALESRTLVSEQRARLAEQALESWKQLDEDRRKMVSEREQQLRDLIEVWPVWVTTCRDDSMARGTGTHDLRYVDRKSAPLSLSSTT